MGLLGGEKKRPSLRGGGAAFVRWTSEVIRPGGEGGGGDSFFLVNCTTSAGEALLILTNGR